MVTQPSRRQQFNHQLRRDLLSRMVLSASGWRAVFGGTDESTADVISPEYRDLAMAAAATFARFVMKTSGKKGPTLVVATDTRPTGPAIADTAIRTFHHFGFDIRWLGVSAAPEVMSYTKQTVDCDAFFYISASHNPQGHNGLKMGLSDGAVIPASTAVPLIDQFRTEAMNDESVTALFGHVADVPPAAMESIYAQRRRWKAEALAVYRAFCLEIATAPGDSVGAGHSGHSADPDRFVFDISRRLADRPLGIVGELNGSARCDSIDRTFLPELGVRTVFHNDLAGRFAHQILPEGAGLTDAAALLQRYHALDPAFQVAYVPDNDGDRGNLVFIDEQGSSVALDAQTVFALVVTVQLAWLQHLGVSFDRVAVVANGPTSLRIDRICSRFGARLFRAEVGEANAVSLARQLGTDGWTVAILGEGSNGGNITPPATVRDPMSTLIALIKLHAYKLASYWDNSLENSDRPLALTDALPPFLTIPTDDERAKMQVGEIPHGQLKKRYEENLAASVPLLLSRLSELDPAFEGDITYRVVNYEGSDTREGPGNRTGDERGGLKVVFRDAGGTDIASVWMRGSGTEPVFRVMADCAGTNTDVLDTLIEWQRREVARAAAL